ncbi:MAG TPA: GNAT family N-acetyltransferase [Acidimicrobiales bacterium]|jgi:GNAT superfamily N-acetyltransferase
MFAGPVVSGRRRAAALAIGTDAEEWGVIRSACLDDLSALGDIERAAGAAFGHLGMAAVADAEPLPVSKLTGFQADGRAWVVVDDTDVPVAYLLVEMVDGNGHVEQVSVHPDHARRGLGRTLLDAADRWAARRGLPALTLTTYSDVPWNAPYYARLGFAIVAEGDLTEGLRRIREREEATGLAAWPRVVMRRPVAPVIDGPGP